LVCAGGLWETQGIEDILKNSSGRKRHLPPQRKAEKKIDTDYAPLRSPLWQSQAIAPFW